MMNKWLISYMYITCIDFCIVLGLFEAVLTLLLNYLPIQEE